MGFDVAARSVFGERLDSGEQSDATREHDQPQADPVERQPSGLGMEAADGHLGPAPISHDDQGGDPHHVGAQLSTVPRGISNRACGNRSSLRNHQ